MNNSPGYSSLDGLKQIKLRRGVLFTVIIFTALIAFEIFNYSTTDYALTDVLGPMKFAGIKWATILSIAFCGIDFAGIARLFSPEPASNEPTETWYLFGAWLLAATMNAILTWWGVSMALVNHSLQSSTVIDSNILVKAVPIFVAVMVWLIRILIIGTLSLAGSHMLRGESAPRVPSYQPSAHVRRAPVSTAQPVSASATSSRPSMRAAGSNSSPVSSSNVSARPATSFQPVYRASVPPNAGSSRPQQVQSEPDFDDHDEPRPIEPSSRNRPDPVYTSLDGRSNRGHKVS